MMQFHCNSDFAALLGESCVFVRIRFFWAFILVLCLCTVWLLSFTSFTKAYFKGMQWERLLGALETMQMEHLEPDLVSQSCKLHPISSYIILTSLVYLSRMITNGIYMMSCGKAGNFYTILT